MPAMISTTAIAKHFDLSAKVVFNFLLQKSWIERIDDHWRLTGKGEFEGGEYLQSKKFGEYIGWPADIVDHAIFHELLELPLTTQSLGATLNIGAHRFNSILAELGWQKRFHRGWTITELGKKQGGIERESVDSGVPYTLWKKEILQVDSLQQILQTLSADNQSLDPEKRQSQANAKDTAATKNAHRQQVAPQDERAETNAGQLAQQQIEQQQIAQQSLGFDDADQTTAIRPTAIVAARDGHCPKTPEQHAVCNWLYLMNVTHAYRWPLEQRELGCCDFYIPIAHLHVECWQRDEDAKAMNEKMSRIEYYQTHHLAYLDLNSEQIANLDNTLPKLLLKFGITVY